MILLPNFCYTTVNFPPLFFHLNNPSLNAFVRRSTLETSLVDHKYCASLPGHMNIRASAPYVRPVRAPAPEILRVLGDGHPGLVTGQRLQAYTRSKTLHARCAVLLTAP